MTLLVQTAVSFQAVISNIFQKSSPLTGVMKYELIYRVVGLYGLWENGAACEVHRHMLNEFNEDLPQ